MTNIIRLLKLVHQKIK
jgi:hypothetical protein